MMIEKTRNFIKSKFNKQNGYLEDADVIYGDTDSVMINFGLTDMEAVMRLGKEAAELCSA